MKFARFGKLLDRCESPIERLFLVGLLFMEDTTFEPVDRDHIVAVDAKGIELGQQVRVDELRIDFTLSYPGVAKRYAVEIDGHQFHGSTPAQFERDAVRYRRLTYRGWTILRYTGREIRRDPRQCAQDALMRADALVPPEGAPKPAAPLLAVCKPQDPRVVAASERLRQLDPNDPEQWAESLKLLDTVNEIAKEARGAR